jgi:hypothetical protein
MLNSLLLSVLVVLTTQSDRPAARNDAEPLAVIRSAFDASSSNLKSGIGHGVFRHYERPVGTKDWKVMTEADMEVHFDGSKYHILLDFTENNSLIKLDRQVIIYDGSAIFTSRFSDQIKPVGSQTSVYSPSPATADVVRPFRAEFPWDVTKLDACLVNVNRLIENIGEDAITIVRTQDGDYVGEHDVGKSGKCVFKWPRKYGYNVSVRQLSTDGEPAGDMVATWRQSDGVWYVESLTECGKYAETEFRDELEYDDFEVNAEVSPDLFTMDALAMPSGSRILDQRPEVKQPIHFVPYEDDEIEAKLGDMVSQLESLPTNWQPAASVKPSRDFGKIMIVLANVIIIAAIVTLVVIRRRRANR